ncbi:MAG: hypothetical protein ACRETI_04005 [Steroidobacteraceae bacterium]
MVKDSRKIAANLAADVVEYSRLMGLDEAAALAALKVRLDIFDSLVAAALVEGASASNRWSNT